MELDSIDQQLLSKLQKGFPLVRNPYDELGLKLGITGEEVISRITRLKTEGIIRQISPVFDARRLGYHTTLVAMRVAGQKLEEAERIIKEHPQISHAYERDHPYNLWLTLARPDMAGIEAEIKRLAGAIAAEEAFQLPATKLFKIGAYFGSNGEVAADAETLMDGTLPQAAGLSDDDRAVVNEVQQDLPLMSRPFADMAARIAMDEESYLAQCRSLRERGIMRRYGVAINHRRAGFIANAMTCWATPAGMVDEVGRKLASLREVSHCYERKLAPNWHYNLFAMIHGRSKEICQEIADRVSGEYNLDDCLILYSTKELKKTRVKYPV